MYIYIHIEREREREREGERERCHEMSVFFGGNHQPMGIQQPKHVGSHHETARNRIWLQPVVDLR